MTRNKSFLPLSVFFVFIFCCISDLESKIFAQGVGINNQGSSPYAGAILDVHSSDKGVLLPRTDTNSIVNPAKGMIIYDTMANVFRYHTGQRWLSMLQEGYYQFWWADMDGDGYGYPFNVIYAPTPPPFYVGNNNDCNDTNPDIHPLAIEICDGLDNDCDGVTDDNVIACDDGNPCTIDYCTEGGCVFEYLPYGTECPDGLCDGGGNCIMDCTNGCDDGNPCTIDYCIFGECVHENAVVGTECPDGLCDGEGQCILNCVNGCDDGNPCTIDYCVNGVCFNDFAEEGTVCPNGLCNGEGECIED